MVAQATQVPVLIVGAGPVGVTIANLLGRYGVETLLIDKSPTVLDYPRAVGLDDEAIRTFQAADLAEQMLRDMIQNVPMRMYSANKKCMAEILPSTKEFGWFRRNLFSQPLGETTLREGLKRYQHVRMALGVELKSLAQDANSVTVIVINESGQTHEIKAQYLVASDGARSTVRESLLNIPYEGKTHAHKWVVIECENDPLDAPYTALHCEPDRPYVCLRLPYGLRRWEFMLFPGEDGEQMLKPEKVNELLRNHVPNPEKLNVIRARVYTHNSRVAGSFVSGRVCLAGDAAHITPPWIGQGLNAGLRDAFNLAWKLAWIIQGRLKPEMLHSYHDERHAHSKAMIDLADLFGAALSQRNRFVAWIRDRLLLSIKNIPAFRDYVLQMKFKPMPRFSKGVVINSGHSNQDEIVGRMFIQPNIELKSGEVKRFDDLVGAGFALLSWRCNPMVDAPDQLISQLKQQLACHILVGIRSRTSDGECDPSIRNAKQAIVVEDLENSLQLWFQSKKVDWVLIRPDRFVAAAGQAEDMVSTLTQFCDLMLPKNAQSGTEKNHQISPLQDAMTA